MNDSILEVLVDISTYLERIAEALEALEDDVRQKDAGHGA